MITVTADEKSLIKDLRTFSEPVQIRDVRGEVLGHFLPISARQAAKSGEPGSAIQDVLGRLRILEQEMRRRKEAGEREFTTEEALEYVRTLRRQAKNGVQTA